MTVSSINPFQPLAPDVGTTYGNIIDAFFNTLSEGQKQAIWVKFLAENNLTDPVPPGSEQLFLLYIQQALADTTLFVPASTNEKLSPDEIKKRNIMFNVFNSVLKMLLSLQQTVTVEAENVAFYARWQKEYTDMLTRVPAYVGGEGSGVQVDLNDLSKFTLGYDNISVRDLSRWWANEIATGLTENFQINTPFSFFILSPTGLQFTSFITGQTAFVPLNPTPGSTFDQNIAYFDSQFRNFWTQVQPIIAFPSAFFSGFLNNLVTSASTIPAGTTNTNDQRTLISAQIFSPTNTNADPFSAMSILKAYTFVAKSNVTDPATVIKNIADANSKARAEINSRDQQYIENIRSKRQVIQDEQSAIQSHLDQSRQTVTQQADLLTSIIDSLKGLIAAIFR